MEGTLQTTASTAASKANRIAFRSLALRLLGIAVAVLIWQLLTSARLMGPQFGPAFSPSSATQALWQLASQGVLFNQILPSLQRIGVGLALALVVGVPVGILVGYYRDAEDATSVVFQFIRMISPLAWMPVAIIAFGVGDRPIYFLVGVVAVWPVLLSTAQGVSRIHPAWLSAARNLGAGERMILWKVIVPAVLPDISAGLRLAIGIAWVVLVPAEMLGVSAGLGYYILDTRDRFRYDQLVAVILVIGAIGYLLDLAARALQRRFAWSWQE